MQSPSPDGSSRSARCPNCRNLVSVEASRDAVLVKCPICTRRFVAPASDVGKEEAGRTPPARAAEETAESKPKSPLRTCPACSAKIPQGKASCPNCGVNYSMARAALREDDSDHLGGEIVGSVLGIVSGPAELAFSLLPKDSAQRDLKKQVEAIRRAGAVHDPKRSRSDRRRKSVAYYGKLSTYAMIFGFLSVLTFCSPLGLPSLILGVVVLKNCPKGPEAASVRTRAAIGIVSFFLSILAILLLAAFSG